MPLSESQIVRYSRHVLLPEVGGIGQERLLAACVIADVGPGRAAEIAAIAYLVAAGVGQVIVRGDVRGPVSEDEARCGILYGADDVGRPRVEAVRERAAALNPDVTITESDEPIPHDAVAIVAQPADGVAAALEHGGAAALELLSRIARHGPRQP